LQHFVCRYPHESHVLFYDSDGQEIGTPVAYERYTTRLQDALNFRDAVAAVIHEMKRTATQNDIYTIFSEWQRRDVCGGAKPGRWRPGALREVTKLLCCNSQHLCALVDAHVFSATQQFRSCAQRVKSCASSAGKVNNNQVVLQTLRQRRKREL